MNANTHDDLDRRRRERRETLEEWYGKPKRSQFSVWEIAFAVALLLYGAVSCFVSTPAWIVHWIRGS